MGHFKFDRTNPESRLRQAQVMEEFLRNGDRCLFFQKALSTGEDGVRPFQLGAFKAAVATGVPIIPVSLAGTRRFLRDGTYIPRPTSVTITLHAPIYPQATGNASEHARIFRLARIDSPARRPREAIGRIAAANPVALMNCLATKRRDGNSFRSLPQSLLAPH